PSVQPGAFALVGMATFYGGVANTPLAAAIIVCEMAGSYDLLVPLILALGVAIVALRRLSLYPAQPRTLRESPVHRHELDPLHRIRCRDVIKAERPFQAISPRMSVAELVQLVDATPDQDVFPVVDRERGFLGIIAVESLRIVAST